MKGKFSANGKRTFQYFDEFDGQVLMSFKAFK